MEKITLFQASYQYCDSYINEVPVNYFIILTSKAGMYSGPNVGRIDDPEEGALGAVYCSIWHECCST